MLTSSSAMITEVREIVLRQLGVEPPPALMTMSNGWQVERSSSAAPAACASLELAVEPHAAPHVQMPPSRNISCHRTSRCCNCVWRARWLLEPTTHLLSARAYWQVPGCGSKRPFSCASFGGVVFLPLFPHLQWSPAAVDAAAAGGSLRPTSSSSSSDRCVIGRSNLYPPPCSCAGSCACPCAAMYSPPSGRPLRMHGGTS
jgi:hypothetical protein